MICCEGVLQTYRVFNEANVCDGFIERVNFLVINTDDDNFVITCNCRIFEFRCILCGHVLCVLTMFDKSTLPSKYIVNRWRLKQKYILVKRLR